MVRDPIKLRLPPAPMGNDQKRWVLICWLLCCQRDRPTPYWWKTTQQGSSNRITFSRPSISPVLERDFHEVFRTNELIKLPHCPCTSTKWKSLVCPTCDIEFSLHASSIRTVIQKWEVLATLIFFPYIHNVRSLWLSNMTVEHLTDKECLPLIVPNYCYLDHIAHSYDSSRETNWSHNIPSNFLGTPYRFDESSFQTLHLGFLN